MLMEQVEHVILGQVRICLAYDAGYLVCIHCPFAILALEILLVSSFCKLDKINSQKDVFPQEFREFSARSLAIVWDEGVSDVIRSLQKSLFRRYHISRIIEC